MMGIKFRLPSEAEWEFAARGGIMSHNYRYSGSNKLEDVAWYKDNSHFTTHPVKEKNANELGLFDMSGNVWEWCYDWYGAYSKIETFNPEGPAMGEERVLRGGSFHNPASRCRVSYRGHNSPERRAGYRGFRIVCHIEPSAGSED